MNLNQFFAELLPQLKGKIVGIFGFLCVESGRLDCDVEAAFE